jgi:hypothetical protein
MVDSTIATSQSLPSRRLSLQRPITSIDIDIDIFSLPNAGDISSLWLAGRSTDAFDANLCHGHLIHSFCSE